MAGAVVAVEAVALRQRADFVGGPTHAIPQTACALQAEGPLQRRHIAGPAENRLTAIASRGRPGHPTGFQQHHAFAGLGQAQRRMQAAETGTNHRYVIALRAGQWRVFTQLVTATVGVVGVEVLLGLLEHKQLMKLFIYNFMKSYTLNFTKASQCTQRAAASVELQPHLLADDLVHDLPRTAANGEDAIVAIQALHQGLAHIAHDRQTQALALEVGHDAGKAHVLRTDQILHWHQAVIEEQLGGVRSPPAHLLQLAPDVETRRALLDQQQADTTETVAAGAHGHRVVVGAHATGNKGLAAADAIEVAVAPRGDG